MICPPCTVQLGKPGRHRRHTRCEVTIIEPGGLGGWASWVCSCPTCHPPTSASYDPGDTSVAAPMPVALDRWEPPLTVPQWQTDSAEYSSLVRSIIDQEVRRLMLYHQAIDNMAACIAFARVPTMLHIYAPAIARVRLPSPR